MINFMNQPSLLTIFPSWRSCLATLWQWWLIESTSQRMQQQPIRCNTENTLKIVTSLFIQNLMICCNTLHWFNLLIGFPAAFVTKFWMQSEFFLVNGICLSFQGCWGREKGWSFTLRSFSLFVFAVLTLVKSFHHLSLDYCSVLSDSPFCPSSNSFYMPLPMTICHSPDQNSQCFPRARR